MRDAAWHGPGSRAALLRVARNILWLLFSQGGTRLLSFVVGTLLARAFGAADFGAYMFVMTYTSYFGILADAGLGRYLIRDVARDPGAARHFLAHIAALRLALAVAAYALMLAVAALTRSSPERLLFIAVAGASVFPGALAGAVASVFNAREEMRVVALFSLLSSLCTAAFVLVALVAGAGLLPVFAAVTLANLPPLLWLLLAWRRRERADGQPAPLLPPLHADGGVWTTALRRSYPYALLTVVGVVYFRIDSLMLTWMQGAAANGIYAAAYRLLDAVTDAPGVVVAALFPALARLHLRPRAELRRAYVGVMALLTALGAVTAVALWLLAGPLISLLYGPEFAASAHVLRLLAPAVFLIFVDTANTMLLYSGDSLRPVLLLSLLTTAVNIALNLLFIPRYSYSGAAAATVLSSAVSLAVFTPAVLRYLRGSPPASAAAAAEASGSTA